MSIRTWTFPTKTSGAEETCEPSLSRYLTCPLWEARAGAIQQYSKLATFIIMEKRPAKNVSKKLLRVSLYSRLKTRLTQDLFEATRARWLVSSNIRAKGSIINIATSKGRFRISTWVFPSERPTPRWGSFVPRLRMFIDFQRSHWAKDKIRKWEKIIMAPLQIL